MAAKWNFLTLLLLINSVVVIHTQLITIGQIPLKTVSDCSSTQFFDITKLACVDCSQNQTRSSDGLSCVCLQGFYYSYVTSVDGGLMLTCERCPANQYASSTGFNCIPCTTGVDNSTNTCRSCSGELVISPERNLLGTPYGGINCQTCEAGTAPGPDGTRCVKCTNVYPITGDNSCSCTGKTQAGGYCFPNADLSNVVVASDLYKIMNIDSQYLKDNLQASFALCLQYKNTTACNVLSNMCALTMFLYSPRDFASETSDVANACEMYFKCYARISDYVPKIYYVNVVNGGMFPMPGDDVLQDTSLNVVYTFSPVSKLEYRVARYTLDGDYLGLSSVENGQIQLCPDTSSKLNAAYVFGTTYTQTCKMAAINFWDTTKYQLEFFDIFLEVTKDGQQELFPIPINILNYVHQNQEINRGDQEDMQLFRRFFLVDNVGTVSTPGGRAEMVRFAKTIHINVKLQTDTNQGIIYPPSLEVEYGSVSLVDAQAGGEVDIEFKVEYTYTDTSYLRDFQIAVGTLSTLGVIYAGYKSWVWSKRSGRPSIDFPTIANFVFYCAGVLANVFFVITFGMAFYWFIFFKRQSVVYLVHPTDSQLRDWLGLFGAAFALKFLEVAHLIFQQCWVDIFFIDWERSRGVVSNSADSSKAKEVPVSIWRTYFVANEWNEIQAVRKINKTFQVWSVVFFLVVVGFENTATRDPDGSVNKDGSAYKAEYSKVYRYAVAVLVFIVIGVLQWIFFTFIYERFFEDKVRQFVDLCSMSNISVFIMSHLQYGHYIHGRSVHGKADTNMREMFEFMKKEEEDMVGQRGLLPNTEQQTFVMALPRKLRLRYEAVILPAQLESAAAAANAGRGGRIAGTAMEKQAEAYSTVNRFLSAFIDRSLKDMNYVIKDKTFLESIMDTEFDDTNEIGVFYNDDGHSFDKILFYGNEMTLLLFDVLTFCIADLIFTNYVIAGVITYLMSELVCVARDRGGEKNLARKTLVDERFLI